MDFNRAVETLLDSGPNTILGRILWFLLVKSFYGLESKDGVHPLLDLKLLNTFSEGPPVPVVAIRSVVTLSTTARLSRVHRHQAHLPSHSYHFFLRFAVGYLQQQLWSSLPPGVH